MTPTSSFFIFALVLFAALLHAGWNTLIKAAPNGLISIALLNLLSGIVGGLILLVLPPIAPEAWGYAALSAAIHLAYCCFLVGAYRQGDLSVIYPIARGSGPLLVACISHLFIYESLSGWEWFGVCIISIGLLTLSRSSDSMRAGAAPVVLALLTGACIAAYTIIDGLGARATGSAVHYVALLTYLMALPLFVYSYLTHRVETIGFFRCYWREASASSAMALISYGIILWAMKHTDLAIVAATREVSVVFAAVLGGVVLKEQIGMRRVACAGIVAGGVAVLYLA